MDYPDKQILSIIQSDFPIVARPYLCIAKKVGLSEAEVLMRLKKLLADGLIRRIGAVLDSKCLGYSSTLCAMQVSEERIPDVATVISSYEGVTHNYIREHKYNLWFTLICNSPQMLNYIIQEITNKTGITVHTLPAMKLFKISVKLPVPGMEVDTYEVNHFR
ncbi:MAG: hypothetical protein APF76_03405 [Desulfitibacter sp. BRH_c19]|nr:MAG: hypothetical protein APF76_03405 [Desulfitibacter sp. BRH_c19]